MPIRCSLTFAIFMNSMMSVIWLTNSELLSDSFSAISLIIITVNWKSVSWNYGAVSRISITITISCSRNNNLLTRELSIAMWLKIPTSLSNTTATYLLVSICCIRLNNVCSVVWSKTEKPSFTGTSITTTCNSMRPVITFRNIFPTFPMSWILRMMPSIANSENPNRLGISLHQRRIYRPTMSAHG